MNSAITYFVSKFPWLASFLSWVLVLLLILAILSLPAYFYLLPLFRKVRAETSAWIERLREQHRQSREQRSRRWEELVDKFKTDNLLKRVKEGGRSLAAGIAVRIKRQLKRLRQQMAKTVAGWTSLGAKAEKLSETLRDFVGALAHPENSAAEMPQLVQQTQGVGVAWLRLVFGVLLLLIMIAANTGMLSQILRDLGFIPPSYTLAGVPLVYILALLLSLVEAGLGFWHATFPSRHDAEGGEKLQPWAWFVLFLTLCASLFEAQNYAGIAPDRSQTINLPFLDYGFPKADTFFLLGFAIVWTLFGVGSVCYKAGVRVIEGTAPIRLLRHLRKARRRALEYDSLLRGSEDVLAKARQDLERAGAIAVDATAVEQLKTELGRLDIIGGQAVSVEEKDLTHTEVVHLANESGWWIVTGAVAALVMTLTGLATFSVLVPSIQTWLAWVLSIGQAVVFLMAGMVFSSKETVAKGETGLVVEAPAWSRIFGTMLAVVLAGFYLWVFLARFKVNRIAWICSLIFGVYLFVDGSRLQPLLGVATLFLRTVMNVVVSAVEFLVWLFASVLHILAVILEYVCEILAGPILALVRRRAGGDATSGNAASAR